MLRGARSCQLPVVSELAGKQWTDLEGLTNPDSGFFFCNCNPLGDR